MHKSLVVMICDQGTQCSFSHTSIAAWTSTAAVNKRVNELLYWPVQCSSHRAGDWAICTTGTKVHWLHWPQKASRFTFKTWKHYFLKLLSLSHLAAVIKPGVDFLRYFLYIYKWRLSSHSFKDFTWMASPHMPAISLKCTLIMKSILCMILSTYTGMVMFKVKTGRGLVDWGGGYC